MLDYQDDIGNNYSFPRYIVHFSKRIYYNDFMFAGRCTGNSDCTGTDKFCLNVGTETAACKRKLSYHVVELS